MLVLVLVRVLVIVILLGLAVITKIYICDQRSLIQQLPDLLVSGSGPDKKNGANHS